MTNEQSIHISLPLASNQDVTSSKESPFPDNLMVNCAGVRNHLVAIAISNSMRSYLVVDFTHLMAKVLKFSEDGVNIMIKST